MTRESSSGDLAARVDLDFVRYANCWEDPELLMQALNPGPGKRVLSIASAGDNAFRLAASGAEVVAVDLNPAQIALCKLKQAAIRAFDRETFLSFIGIHPGERMESYLRLQQDLDPETRAYWDARPGSIQAGILHDGKFERYFRLFRTRVLSLITSRKRIHQLLTPREGVFARKTFYETRWNHVLWRGFFRIFFSRWMMGRLGRDPEFFTYVEGSVADRILDRTRYAMVELEPARNPWMHYILTGNFLPVLPPYLEEDVYPQVQRHIDRVTFLHMGLEEAAEANPRGFDGYNLSDVFEYLSPEHCGILYEALLEAARPGARLAYWNMLVPRECPAAFRARVQSLDALAEKAFRLDRAWFYSRFLVEEVKA